MNFINPFGSRHLRSARAGTKSCAAKIKLARRCVVVVVGRCRSRIAMRSPACKKFAIATCHGFILKHVEPIRHGLLARSFAATVRSTYADTWKSASSCVDRYPDGTFRDTGRRGSRFARTFVANTSTERPGLKLTSGGSVT